MPYQRSLQAFTPPEFYREPPPEWKRRLREVSPVLPNMDHLIFRYFGSENPDGEDRGWRHPERGQWTLYAARPIRLIANERAADFDKHWSELSTEGEQIGRQSIASDYQHFMWHTRGLYVKPFLILQGDQGGTPTNYTPMEREILRNMGAYEHPLPLGTLPACPFDNRTITMIHSRDRLKQVVGDYEALEKLDSESAQRREREAALRAGREQYLKTFRELNRPCAEFYDRFRRTEEAKTILQPAPDGLANRVDQWRDHFIETGRVIGAAPATATRVSVTVQ